MGLEVEVEPLAPRLATVVALLYNLHLQAAVTVIMVEVSDLLLFILRTEVVALEQLLPLHLLTVEQDCK